MSVRFETTNGASRWALTEGVAALGQAEIAVPINWTEDEGRDQQVVRLLMFIEAYINQQSRRILAGEVLTYGWTTLQFRHEGEIPDSAENERLIVHELHDSLGSDDSGYVAGVDEAIALVEAQERALRRNRITGVAEHPHRMHSAIVCSEVTRRSGELVEPLMLERTERVGPRDSGWVLRCVSQTHNHDDPAELHSVHLLHVVNLWPVTFAYLAMPMGTAVMLSEREVVVFPPGQNDGVPDPNPEWQLPGQLPPQAGW
jgi:hypothetical protein